jgi:hypothetical protein
MTLKRILVAATAVLTLTVTGTAAAAAPENTVRPTLSGAAREGTTLTASRGSWANSPTSYAYTWQRCASDGTGCGAISGASKETYTLVLADVGRTVRVLVTAVNSDGRDVAPSEPTEVVASKNGPKNTARPAISGDTTVGGELTTSNGSWTPAPASYTYQWQRCDTDGTNCFNVAGASGQTYGVRAVDEGMRMRVLVTARTQAGDRATASSAASDIVVSDTPPPPVANKPPSIKFVALVRIGARVYARFRVCDDGLGKVTVVQRDQKAHVASFARRFAVRIQANCGAFTRSWVPAKRFRTAGTYTATLRAIDKSQRPSRMVSKSLRRH